MKTYFNVLFRFNSFDELNKYIFIMENVIIFTNYYQILYHVKKIYKLIFQLTLTLNSNYITTKSLKWKYASKWIFVNLIYPARL
jgi:hypothetical protein